MVWLSLRCVSWRQMTTVRTLVTIVAISVSFHFLLNRPKKFEDINLVFMLAGVCARAKAETEAGDKAGDLASAR